MEKQELLYEGKAKRVYATADPDLVIVEYKDDATAFNGLKKGQINNKGVLNNRIAGYFFELLAAKGIASHYIRQLSAREMLVKKLQILKVEVVVRNLAAGSLAKRLGLEEGTSLRRPVLELYYKDDELQDPMINEYHLYALEIATEEQVRELTATSLKINEILIAVLQERQLVLVDFKLEFGLFHGSLLLGDEISPDTCRFWDAGTREKLDKDRFRRDLGGVEEAYEEILRRLTGGN
ncbi:MAG: phosphoribosylaminoimidazolesuccinocarboxamide synthase [Dethiobacter sp.]|nr:phosphoribosylaminoimidazolesuccinocarboxamide synthase [Dethiobacter sp.]MBS3900295.1 phosphoribosylaminoimidazolesuccinocarboxamide synthase [Dethiobacter sp.]MBS3982686.1 phosphoribosylaminoimidazolesuccinocarboxamide synthase [Dethiobacter sp.]MCL4462896.1 phosphoribosylaminoimidazolesuccinocarboxamide synthase [Bacillota bacterium]MCL5993409.1 phosphoribosylaminoimidazolesuccinocarboxamide synthase [Bacillota bacterium]